MKHGNDVFSPARLYDVVTALRAIPSMPLFTMTEVRGFPGPDGDRASSRAPREIDSLEMVEIGCLISEVLLPRVVDALEAAGRADHPDDFSIVVIEAEDIVAAGSASQ